METLNIILLSLLIASLVANIILGLIVAANRKQYRILSDLEQFEDQLLLQLIAISEGIVQDTNRFFSENLIAGIPEVQSLMSYVRKMRDLYRIQIKEYNTYNQYRNRVVIEEFLDQPGEE